MLFIFFFFFFQAEDGIRDLIVTGVQTCALPIFGQLVANGRLTTPPRPWLGLHTGEYMGQLVVGNISEGGPADRAGLQRGDILHALNGEVLDDVADFYRKLWASGPAGTAVTLRLERDNDSFEVTVRTGDRARYHKYGSD